jgi:hypothetical protein
VPAESVVYFERRAEVSHDPDLRTLLIWSRECPLRNTPHPCLAEERDKKQACPYYLATMANGIGANVHCARNGEPGKEAL